MKNYRKQKAPSCCENCLYSYPAFDNDQYNKFIYCNFDHSIEIMEESKRMLFEKFFIPLKDENTIEKYGICDNYKYIEFKNL
jgi:hypothetical protein